MSTPPLHIHVHDFGGHPFQAQLSRELARRGMLVEHSYSAQDVSGKGRLALTPDDPNTLSFVAIAADRPFEKYSALGRLRFELSYAVAWTRRLRESRPDVVVVCNTPLFAAVRFRRWARRNHVPWVLWHQDIISLALVEEARRKLPRAVAAIAAWVFSRLERGNIRGASRVVAIGEEFRRYYSNEWKLNRSGISIIPNWAPLDEITPRPIDNPWSTEWVAERGDLMLLYAGTLGRKHNPGLLVDLISASRTRGVDARLIVVSEGEGAEVIRTRAKELVDGVIRVIPFQPAVRLPDVLGAGDVLIAILEPEASKFSIPSKVLSYLAAGRPVIGLMPADNPAAADIVAAGGGVFPPNTQGVARAAEWIASFSGDSEVGVELGRRSRTLAEARFGIDQITEQFYEVFAAAKGGLEVSPS